MKAPLQPGDRVDGRYEIVRPLGASELSRVYLARERGGGGLKFVVKEIAPPVSHPRDLERINENFRREAAKLANLKHPSLPKFAEWFQWEGLSYVVREYLEEHTLQEVVAAGDGPPPALQIRTWMSQLCDGFSVLHQQSPPFVFSGLKPQSMVISPLGKVRIMDFPVTCFLTPELQWKYARQTAPGWISPEQARGEAPTVASDVYNLGTIYYFMLTRADPALYPYARHRFPIHRPQETAPEVLDVLERALTENPAARFASAAELKDALLAAGSQRPYGGPEAAFDLDTHEVVLEEVKQGNVVRSRVKMVSKTGRDIYGKLRADQPWIRFKFDIFRGKFVEIDFSVDTFDLVPGQSYSGVVQVDTEHGVDEIQVRVDMAAPLGTRFSRLLKGIFLKQDGEF